MSPGNSKAPSPTPPPCAEGGNGAASPGPLGAEGAAGVALLTGDVLERAAAALAGGGEGGDGDDADEDASPDAGMLGLGATAGAAAAASKGAGAAERDMEGVVALPVSAAAATAAAAAAAAPRGRGGASRGGNPFLVDPAAAAQGDAGDGAGEDGAMYQGMKIVVRPPRGDKK
ncbi:hypothetical protein MNEG_16300 [Monoraphidium neglectum]|uniref:Uncharacterized protein n=1 Tax=Monoraphidium neglectum TaxID=145388 RepID=A0A0D2LI32_9CHLO|nr:hypothetical protein MNEG_16300 [Monoraphidium neglectum]KIY91664.1 hypothetical protein MNEG_16300 [Monoraphidium neglectum]|eukprot:XP_013890684.1 hypothetical protein MNEG_16300 [Monoraphidium neglectum]